jgi:PAS domain S-box-containing protein
MNEEAAVLGRVPWSDPQPLRDGSPGLDRSRAEALAASQARILEGIASGAPLAEVFHALVLAIEAQGNGVIGSLLLLEDGVLRHGAAPGLPEVYCRAVDGTPVGPCAGSCGTAAYTGQPVIVADIATDPLWADYRHLALPHGLRACWSQPILARDGTVLGTFAMYYREPRVPEAHERRLIETAAHVASIAIERARSEQALRQREAGFRLMFSSSPLPMWVHDLSDLRILEVNQAATAQYGYSREEFLEMRVGDLRPPEASADGRAADGAPEDGVWRHRRKDGSVLEARILAHTLTFRGRRAALVVAEDVTEPRRREHHLAILARLDHALGSAATAAEAARSIAACVGDLWRWDALRVDLYDPDRDLLEPVLAFESVDGGAVESRPPARSVTTAERLALETGTAVTPDERTSHVVVPIRAGGRPIGILNTHGRAGRRRGPDDLQALQDLADRCGGALERIHAADRVRRSEERLRVEYAVTRILAESADPRQAGPALLEALCCVFDWRVGGLWLVVRDLPWDTGVLRCASVYPPAGDDLAEFLDLTRHTVYARGTGLPGRVWSTGQAAVVTSLGVDDDPVRGTAAARHGLDGSCAFPLPVDGEIVGVLDFFGAGGRPPDRDVLMLMSDVGRQLGQYLARHRAEEAVRDSEARFRSVFQSAGAGMGITDTTGRFLLVNPVLARFLGHRQDELVGVSVYDLTHPDDRDETARQAGELDTGQRRLVDMEKRYVRKDGSVVWGHTTVVGVPQVHGEPNVRFAIIQDITKRKRAEEALRESEERYRTLFASSMDAIFMADREGRLLDANPATLALFGFSQAELGGLRMTDLYVGRSSAYSFLRTIAREGGVQDFGVKLRRRDGTPMDCIVTARARRDAAGRVVRYEGVIRDVTAQRAAERGLRNLSGHLLRVQDEERRRLARELHDSTGQDLAALAMNLAAALQQPDGMGVRARKAVADSQAIADRCAKGLRTLSYLLHPPLLDEMGLVTALRWLADGFQARSGIHLALRLPEDLGRLGPEMETALFRIVQEALTNVHRHSGGRRAWVRLDREPRSVSLEIEDDGGAAAPPRPGARRPGLGVGIAGMRERARQLGGRLDVSSGGHGTLVRAVFPLSEGR